jgi:DNA invertase Pin-like site-specific DNA recombinase
MEDNSTRRRRRRVRRKRGVVGYTRVSTEEQAASGLGLEAQRAAILAEVERRNLDLVEIFEDAGASARTLGRPGLSAALDALDGGEGDVLMVAKLDRLTRSVHDATSLMARAEQSGWGLVALDAPVDTTTPQGAAMAQVIAVFAELERKMIGQRTRDALAVRRAQGVRLGRPPTVPPEVVSRIVGERRSGVTWRTIAERLDADEIPTGQGGTRWWPSTVRAVHCAAAEAVR